MLPLHDIPALRTADGVGARGAGGRNIVYMAISAIHLSGVQTLEYEKENKTEATAILSETQANFVAGQTYSKSITVLSPSGIYVPSGSTLTIGGTGTLDASNIGGGTNLNCGNIVINSGN